MLDFSQPAATCHNKVRAFAGWPSTFATFTQASQDGSSSEPLELKVVRTRLAEAGAWPAGLGERQVAATKDALLIRCGDGGVLQVRRGLPRCAGVGTAGLRAAESSAAQCSRQCLTLRLAFTAALLPVIPPPRHHQQVLEVQAPGKRAMAARDFVNGLKGRTLSWQPAQQPQPAAAA